MQVRHECLEISSPSNGGEAVQAGGKVLGCHGRRSELAAIPVRGVDTASAGAPLRLFAHPRGPVGEQPSHVVIAQGAVGNAGERHVPRFDKLRGQECVQLLRLCDLAKPLRAGGAQPLVRVGLHGSQQLLRGQHPALVADGERPSPHIALVGTHQSGDQFRGRYPVQDGVAHPRQRHLRVLALSSG